jgi:hypothetical protein
MANIEWPKREFEWIENGVLHISVPFTWCLPRVQKRIASTWMPVKVGGPAVYLIPNYLKGAEIGHDANGALQRINPMATRSTVGCPRRCPFCAVPRTEGRLLELSDWPDLPIYCDNNILAASLGQFDRVMDRLEGHGWGDFNQGVDAGFLNEHHAERMVRVKGLMVRLALDSQRDKKAWSRAYTILRSQGIPKNRIRSYVMVAFNTGVDEAWERCKWVKGHGVLPLPMWYHPLNAMRENIVTEQQKELGWNNKERMRIMRHYYH